MFLTACAANQRASLDEVVPHRDPTQVSPFPLGDVDALCALVSHPVNAVGGLRAIFLYRCPRGSRSRPWASTPQPPPSSPGPGPWAWPWWKPAGRPSPGGGEPGRLGKSSRRHCHPALSPATARGVYLRLCYSLFSLSLFFSLGVGTPWVQGARGEPQLIRVLPVAAQ